MDYQLRSRFMKAEDAYRAAETEKQNASRAEAESKAQLVRDDELKRFQKSLKPGDRIQWRTANVPMKGVGMVIRIDGELAFIQFDNLTFSGQPVRYIKKSELEPFDGNMPNARFDVH